MATNFIGHGIYLIINLRIKQSIHSQNYQLFADQIKLFFQIYRIIILE